MAHGCGSSEGATCRLGDDVAGVTGFVYAVLFLGEVVAPVFVEVAVGGDGAEFEDGFGAVQAPAGAGDVHAVFDEVSAGAFDDAGGDRPAGGQGGGVVEVFLLVVEVVGGGVGVASLLVGQCAAGGGAADRGGDQAGVAGQDLQGLVGDPLLRLGVAFGVETPGRLPDVFKNVDEVDDAGDGDLPGSGVSFDLVDLVVVAVHQGDPGPGVVGVAAPSLVEHRRDDPRGGVGDAGREPLADGFRPGGLGRSAVRVTGDGGGQGDDVGRGPRRREDLVDRAHLGHAFAVTFLTF